MKKILLALSLLFATAHVAHAADVVSNLVDIMNDVVLPALVLITIIITAIAFLRGSYKAVIIGFVAVFFLVLVNNLLTGSGSPYADTSILPTIPVDIRVYGQDASTSVHRGTQVGNYLVIEGYMAMGAHLLSRIMSSLFTIQGFVLVVLIGAAFTIYQAVSSQQYSPFVWFLIKLVFVGGFIILPVVNFTGPTPQNPVYSVFERLSDAPTVQDNRIPILPAYTINGMTEIAESLGESIQIGQDDFDQIILNAAKKAKLKEPIEELYYRYADNCFTSVYNLSKVGVATSTSAASTQSAYVRFANSMQNRLVAYRATPTHNRHALSAASEALFKDVDFDAHIINDRQDYLIDSSKNPGVATALKTRFRNTAMVDIGGEARQATIDPFTGGRRISTIGLIDQYYAGRGIFGFGARNSLEVVGARDDRYRFKTNWATNDTPMRKPFMVQHILDLVALKDSNTGRPYSRLFCATNAEDFTANGDWVTNQDNTLTTLPDIWREAVDDNAIIQRISRRDLGDYIRKEIGTRYLDAKSGKICLAAAENYLSSDDFWGCLIGGHYTSNSGTVTDSNLFATVRAIQKRFDDEYREDIKTQSGKGKTALTNPRSDWAMPPIDNLSTWVTPIVPSTGIDPDNESAYAQFTDMFMVAQGVQMQVGMYDVGETYLASDSDDEDNIILKTLEYIGGVVITSIVDLFAWLGEVMSTVAQALYPHVMGLSFFLLLLVFPAYAAMTFIPGRGMVIFEWVKACLWVALWPLSISIGLGMINQAGVYGLENFYTTVQNTDISTAVMKIFGAMFIFMAPSMSGLLITLSFGALSGAIGGIAGTGFRLAGAAGMIGASILALAATAFGGAGGFLLGGLSGALKKVSKETGKDDDGKGDKDTKGKKPDGGSGKKHFEPGKAGQSTDDNKTVWQRAREGGAYGARMGTNAGDVATSLASTGAEIGDLGGGDVSRGMQTGARAGMIVQRGVMGADGDGRGGLMGTVGSLTKGRGSAALAAGDQATGEADKLASDPMGRQAAYLDAAQKYDQSASSFVSEGDYASAALAGQRSYESYRASGDSQLADAAAQEAMSNARLAIQNNPGDRRAVATSQMVLGSLGAQTGISQINASQSMSGSEATNLFNSGNSALREANTSLTEAQTYYGNQASNSLARMETGRATPEDLQSFNDYGSASLAAARYRDNIASAGGVTTNYAGDTLSGYGTQAQRLSAENQSQVDPILEKLQDNMNKPMDRLELPKDDAGKYGDRL